MHQKQSFSATVFAGGASSRMGTDKAFLRLGDELLLERQLRCLRDAGASQLLISGRTDVDYSHFGPTVVYDKYPDGGPLSGLAAILKAAAFGRTMILAVDMPAMNPAMVKKSFFAAETIWDVCRLTSKALSHSLLCIPKGI